MRALRTALLLTAGLLLGPGAGVVHAGPGITFYPKNAPVIALSGGQIAASADLPARTYTLPGSASQPGRKVTLRGLSIGALLSRYGVTAQRVQVVNSHGGSFVVTPAQYGTAMLSDDGTTTRFFRSSGGVLTDYTEDNAVALDVSADGGDLAISATASPKRVKAGESVTFSAKVRFGAPGANYTFQWEFGEGPVPGQSVTHTPDIPGTLFAQVEVTNADPSCTTRCGGTERVTVEVGEAPEQPEDTAAGGANGTPGGAGSSGGTGGGGTGGSGSGAGSGAGTDAGGEDASTPAPEPKPPPPPPKPFGTTISGVLINDTGTTVSKLPAGAPAGAAAGVRAVRGGETAGSLPLGLSGLLALAVMWFGALRERRGVRLRVA